jgi:Sec-independent protein translocase protein TatA
VEGRFLMKGLGKGVKEFKDASKGDESGKQKIED